MRILMTTFGWGETGGNPLPREIALELVRRGHDVAVLHAAARPQPDDRPHTTRTFDDNGVRCIAVSTALFTGERTPARELFDPEIVRVARQVFAEFRPDFVHWHDFLGLSAGVTEITAATGAPSCYTPHTFWALCPTLHLLLPDLAVCGGVAVDGANCVACTRSTEPGTSFVARRDRVRDTLLANVTNCLVPSEAGRREFVKNGYPAEWLHVLRPGSPRVDRIWNAVGRDRSPRFGGPLRIGFVGPLLPSTGLHVLVEAAQQLRGSFEIHVHGVGQSAYVDKVRTIDQRHLVTWHGAFGDDEHPLVLSRIDVGVVPSVGIDHAPLVVDEMQAARVPVLGARIGGIPEQLQSQTGELFAPGNARSLAAALQVWIDTPQAVAERQRRMAAPPTFACHVDALVATYERALARRSRSTAPAAKLKLNLGCGKDHLPGFVNVDKFAASKPDRVIDLEEAPWPLPDDCASEVLMKHVLEHLGRDSDTFLAIWKELYRVCAPGATVRIVVPHPRHQDFLQDPTHVRPILPELFTHFSLEWNRRWAAKGLPGTPLAEYLGVDFSIVNVELRLDPHWKKWLEADPTRGAELERAIRTHNDVVQEVDVVLRVEKPFGKPRDPRTNGG